MKKNDRSEALFRRTLKTGHVSMAGLDIALKNASHVQEGIRLPVKDIYIE
jgi:hypothetical protein